MKSRRMKKINFLPRAIIFDMDGVIIDSMPYHYLAWYEALRPWGISVKCFDVYQREGERWDKTLKDLLRQARIRPTEEVLKKIFSYRQKIFKKYFKRYIFKGVDRFLFCLKQKGYILGLVTGTPSHEIRAILPRKIRTLFDCVVAGDAVKYGKPNPAPYLRALRLLRLKAGQCLVVENAPLGIRSAKAAGIFCLALNTSLPSEYLKEADLVVEKLEDIPGLIERSCAT
jgi:beta-phosphoglucomutase